MLIPPKGYLQRLRQICDKHGILLIFDEVITGFGRTGNAFAAQTFGVTPDMITCAKALTNAAVPMGAVVVKKEIYDAFMQGPENCDRAVSTATPTPVIRWPLQPRSRRSICSRRRVCSSAPPSWRRIGKTRRTRSRACRTSSTFATSA